MSKIKKYKYEITLIYMYKEYINHQNIFLKMFTPISGHQKYGASWHDLVSSNMRSSCVSAITWKICEIDQKQSWFYHLRYEGKVWADFNLLNFSWMSDWVDGLVVMVSIAIVCQIPVGRFYGWSVSSGIWCLQLYPYLTCKFPLCGGMLGNSPIFIAKGYCIYL